MSGKARFEDSKSAQQQSHQEHFQELLPDSKAVKSEGGFQPWEKATEGAISERGGLPVFLEVGVPHRCMPAICFIQGESMVVFL